MQKEVARNPFELAHDAFTRAGLLNKINCSAMTLSDDLCVLFTIYSFEVIITVVECCHKVGCRTTGFAAADKAVFNKHHFFSRPGKTIGRGYSCNTATNDYNVTFKITG